MIQTFTELIPAPVAGLNYSKAGDEVSPLEMTACQNVSIQDGLIQKRHGYRLFGTNLPLSGPIMGFDQYRKMSGATYLLAMTTKDLYRWNSSTTQWDLLTESGTLDDCEDDPVAWIAAANVTVSRETSDIKAGSAAVKISPSDSFTTGQLAIHEDTFGDISDYDHIRFWIKSSIDLSAGDLQLVLNATGKSAILRVSKSESLALNDALIADIDALGGIVRDDVALTDSVTMSISPATTLSVAYADLLAVRDIALRDAPLRTVDLPALSAATWTQVLLDLRVLGLTTDLSDVGAIGLSASSDFGACDLIVDDFKVYDCFTGSDSQFFSFDHIRKIDQTDLWWCCSNGVDDIKKYDGNAVSDVTTDGPKAGVLRQFKDYLFALDTVEGGSPMHQRARWPDTGDPTNWLTGNASYRDLPGSDWIKEALRYKGDYLVVLKDKSLWLGYASDDDELFRFDNKVPEIGCAAGRTAICLGEEIVFLGWDDFYYCDGIEAEGIGKNVRKELFRILKTEEIGRAFGAELDDEKEYWLHVVSTTSDYPDIAWVLNRELAAWTRHAFADYFTACGYYYIEDALRIGDLTMKIRDMTWRIGDRRLLSRTPTLLFGDKDGYTYEYNAVEANDNGTAIDAWFDTKDSFLAGPDARMRVVRLDVYYTGASLEVYYSTDKGTSWTLLTTLGTSTTLEYPQIVKFRINCQQIRWRFRNAETDQTFAYQRAVMYWQKAGTRLYV